MSTPWYELVEHSLIAFAVLIATLLAPWRIVRFLRTQNHNPIIYPTPIARDFAVLFVTGAAAGLLGAGLSDWMFWSTGTDSKADASSGGTDGFAVFSMWQMLTLVPFYVFVMIVSERRAISRLEAAHGKPLEWKHHEIVNEIHSPGLNNPFVNPFALSGAAIFLINWLIAAHADGTQFSWFAHFISWALPVGFSFALLRLIGVRL